MLALQDVPASVWNAKLCFSLSGCNFEIFSHSYAVVTSLLVTGASFVITLLILKSLSYPFEVELREPKPIPSELIGYSFPYIVSFMGVDYATPGKVAGLIVFLIWLFMITYRAGEIIMNPLLLVFGWNLYECKINLDGSGDRVVRVLSRRKIGGGIYKCQLVQDNYICEGN
ncbi:hypothetical protein [Ottowia testudinis]|uniref:Uncharacterized protein n=1 Tax=Ottowia testudinis TaxID=2816950 RepID=A0A975CI03_9BURK|nr:hypothetical protein [Ottowia testudinis]QTD46176.1 hypothetical protein J1M35_04530 [Ottowia testudinis]